MRKGIIGIVVGLCLALSQTGWARQSSSKSLGMERMEPTPYEQKRVSTVKHKKYVKRSKKGVKNVHVKGKKRTTHIQHEVGYQEDGFATGRPASRKTGFGGTGNTENLPMNQVFPEHR